MKPLHWTALKWMRKSPAHYQYWSERRLPMTAPMRIGWLSDRIVFNRRDEFVVYGGRRQGKAWDEFEAANAGIEIVTGTEMARAQDIAASVLNCAEAVKVLSDGAVQNPLVWSVDGRDCVGTPDVCGIGITELKVTDPNPAKFGWHARGQGWHGQLAWYAHGLGRPVERYTIVAVDPKPPHVVVVHDLSERTIEEGTRMWRGLFERLRVCEESNHWPGYTEGVSLWDVPDDEPVMLQIDGEEVEV